MSGHINHIQTYLGVLKLANTCDTTMRKNMEFYSLHSTSLPFKYMSWLAILYYRIIGGNDKVFINSDAHGVWAPMEAHYSQLVWFRKIYLSFSSFVYINCMKALK